MATEVAIDGTGFLINGRPTYEGVTSHGRKVEGLLLNSRMIQAVFDDACEETRKLLAYPDTGEWDPDRNTDEFCAALPVYRAHGLLAVTVGLQGGGSVFTPEVYGSYANTAFEPDGALKAAYFDRLLRILRAADDCGMVVIVNYFYCAQHRRIPNDDVVFAVAERVSEWLLASGHRNVLVDVANESADWWKRDIFLPANVQRLIEVAKGVTVDGRRLLVGCSTGGGGVPEESWLAAEDLCLPHGNGCRPADLKDMIRRIRATDAYTKRPRPIVINEDSIFACNLEAAVDEYVSWGFYCQGYGSHYRDLMDWTTRPREDAFEDLSGYQTVPVNWGINTPIKRAFFDCVRQITQGA